MKKLTEQELLDLIEATKVAERKSSQKLTETQKAPIGQKRTAEAEYCRLNEALVELGAQSFLKKKYRRYS